MKFKSGDLVKVLYKRSPNHPAQWTEAVYHSAEPFSVHKVELDEQVLMFCDNEIVAFVPLSDEALAAFGDKNLPELLKLIETSMKALLREDMLVPCHVDGESVVISGNLTVDLCRQEVTALGRLEEVPAFMVATWRRIHNYPHEPDDIEGYEEGVARTIEGAASLAVKVWFLYHLDGYWQAYADNKMVEEYHELEAAARDYWNEPTRVQEGADQDFDKLV